MMTDQPTPTSSLEEARDQLERCIIGNCPHAAPEVCIHRFEAAARAEVIREVEADTVLYAASKAIHDESAKRVGCSIPWEMHDDGYVERTKRQVGVMLTAVVRALSQGGEI